MSHVPRVHCTVDDNPTLCGTHLFTKDTTKILLASKLKDVTCGNCKKKIMFMLARPITLRRSKKIKASVPICEDNHTNLR